MNILMWIAIGFLFYSFILVPALVYMAVEETVDGKLLVKDIFVARKLYEINFTENNDNFVLFPKNICQFYKGVWIGIFFIIFCYLFATICFIVIYGWAPLAFLAGYMPNPIGFYAGDDCYEPYEKIGNKRWIAPWKFILPIGVITLMCLFPNESVVATKIIVLFLEKLTIFILFICVFYYVIYFLIMVAGKFAKILTATHFFKKICKDIEQGQEH